MDLEQRLKNHLNERGQRLAIERADPSAVMNPEPGRSGKALQVMTAVLVVVAAGAGFWMLSDDTARTTEIAAGEPEESEQTDEAKEATTGNGADAGSGDEASRGDGMAASTGLEFTNITSDLSPSGDGRSVIDNGVYYLLSTAPGRVQPDYEAMSDSDYVELFRPNTFYTYDNASGWAAATVEDRFVSDFDVNDGVLYVVSTGGVNRDQASIGTSTDRGRSWAWTDLDGLPPVTQIDTLTTDEQTLIFARRWGSPDWEQAVALAASAGITLDERSLYELDGNGFTYVPLTEENRCDFVLGQILPAVLDVEMYRDEMGPAMTDDEFEAFRAEQLGWVEEEASGSGCSLPENLDELTIDDIPEPPEPVTKTWAGLGVETPDSWTPWVGLFRLDGSSLTPLDLPFGPERETGYVSTAEGELLISTFASQTPAEGPGAPMEQEGETVFATSDGASWREEYRPFPTGEDADFSPWYHNEDGYHPPVAGDRTFRIWWDETMIEVGPDGEPAGGEEAWTEPTPELQQRVGDGSWETVDVEEALSGTNIGDRQLWEVRGSTLGVFLVFGPRWDDQTDQPTEDGHVIVFSSNGVDWQSIELAGQGFTVVNNDDELLVFSTDWHHEDGQYSVTESYLVRPTG